jgi:uncharacterized protein
VILAVVIALSSIILGAALGLLPGSAQRSQSPLRTFAMVVSVAVVLGQMLPESIAELGIAGLLAFAAGFLAPRLLERLAAAMSRPACVHDDAMCTDLGLELGYVGLLLHHVGDGIGLGLYAGPLHEGHHHYDVLAALAGHTVPLTALVVLAFRTHRGPVNAALRALGIALSTLVGVGLASMLSSSSLDVWEPWLTALVGGLLLHVVAHGWPVEPAPTRSSRLMDFAALAAGAGMLSIGGHSHAGEHGAADPRLGMATAVLGLLLEIAPPLLVGVVVAALLMSWSERQAAVGSVLPVGRLRGALRGVYIALVRPQLGCGALVHAQAMRARGAGVALTTAVLIAAPALGMETFALGGRLLGWPFAGLRVVGGVIAALLVALVMASPISSGPTSNRPAEPALAFECGSGSGWVRRTLSHFEALLYGIGAWIALGLLAAAYVHAALEPGALSGLARSGLDIALLSVLALPGYLSAAAATPLAAVLVGKGVSPGAVLAGLLLAPTTSVAVFVWLRTTGDMRRAVLGHAALCFVGAVLALVANAVLPRVTPALAVRWAPDEVGTQAPHGIIAYFVAAILIALCARGIWRNGLRAWLAPLNAGAGLLALRHGHDHEHQRATHGAASDTRLEHDSRLVAAVGVGTELHDRMQRKR